MHATPVGGCLAILAATFSKAGEALTPGEFGLLVLVDPQCGLSQMGWRAHSASPLDPVPILDGCKRRLLMRHRSPTDGRTHRLA